MLSDVRRFAFTKCKDLANSRARAVQLVKLFSDFTDKTGEVVAEHTKTFAAWLSVDVDTKMKAERKNLVEGQSDFTKVCEHLEMLGKDELNKEAAGKFVLSDPGFCFVRPRVPGGPSPPFTLHLFTSPGDASGMPPPPQVPCAIRKLFLCEAVAPVHASLGATLRLNDQMACREHRRQNERCCA